MKGRGRKSGDFGPLPRSLAQGGRRRNEPYDMQKKEAEDEERDDEGGEENGEG